jgi:hypothetical protein
MYHDYAKQTNRSRTTLSIMTPGGMTFQNDTQDLQNDIHRYDTLNAILLNVILLNVILLNVIPLNVILMNVILQRVI